MTNIYLSGRFSITAKKERAWLKRTGCKHRCFSFAVTDPLGINYSKEVVKALDVCEKKKINIMMDSGAHSIHVLTRSSRKRGAKAKTKQAVDINVLQQAMYERYVKYCHENKKKWSFFVTLDFKRDQNVIYKMQQQFRKDGLEAMPVIHGESKLEYWIKKHYDMGHRYMCLGGASFHRGSMAEYFDTAFNLGAKLSIKYHGLAFTSLTYITQWQWESVDSSTWSRCAAFGQLVFPDFKRNRFYNVHVSDRECKGVQHSLNKMRPIHQQALKTQMAQHGFDLDAMRTSEEERHDWNGFVYSNLAKVGLDWDAALERKVTWASLI